MSSPINQPDFRCSEAAVKLIKKLQFSEANCHVYVNVDTKEIGHSLREEMHCYANIDTRDMESIQALQV